jgi:putative spermidine/putrescine transport system permease protein
MEVALSAGQRSKLLGPWAPRMLAVGPASVFLFLLLVVPLLATLYLSLQPNVLLTFDPPSFANYAHLLSVPYYYEVLLRTLRTAFVSTLIALLIGYPSAYVLKLLSGRFAGTMVIGLTFPILAGPLVVILGWMILLADGGPILRPLIALGVVPPLHLLGSEAAVDISLVHFTLPFVILTLHSSFKQIPNAAIEAARSLGASWWQVVRHVIWPLSVPGVTSAVLIAFSLSASSYISPHYLGGPNQLTLTSIVAQFVFGTYNVQLAGAAALLLLAVMAVTTLAFTKLTARMVRL